MALTLRNPHSVLAALQTRPHDVTHVTIPSSSARESADDDVWARVAGLARQNRIPVSTSGGGRDRSGPQPKEGRQGGAEAHLAEREPVSAEELFADARERDGGKGLWIALDSLTDPHNVGAIFRAAAFFGVQGILMTQERSAPLSGTAYDVACGGVEHVPFAIEVNLARAFEKAKEAGLWILGTSEHANDDLVSIDKDRPWLLVLGNEEKGMRRLTEENCDLLCAIKPRGEVTSLNVSVAAGIFIATLSPGRG